ncbi:Syntaxin-binding protein 5 [Glycine soja]|uniref:Syntaxin-binding protein 5 n=1 Tax=Glycine soja TaxID=3848 RepID=A0A0B2SPK6_GLYSO|nr:Syntaxin-binding protein 5 [Glycine soja]
MFSRFFNKSPPQQRPQQQDVAQESFPSGNFDPRVVLHYGVPSNASILAFDHIQRLLAVGTLDGRMKVFGGDNIEGTLISPKQAFFKNLEFLENQGFLASVSSDNEIQVWDLKSKQIASALQWESIITAFSVIYGTSYILLIAYENGLMVLWDASEDRIVLIRGHKDIKLKRKIVTSYPNDSRVQLSDDKLDHEEEDKEISSVSWASNDGSVVVVGYVDGDIMFWDLSTADFPPDQQVERLSNNVVKLQLSSADRRLPIIVLHWCANNSGGKLFVYGGHEIGSEEVLTVLSIDWSCGIENLKCTDCIDVTLHGSFADMTLLSTDCHTEGACNMLFILTSPGQLDLYDNDCLSSTISQQEKKASVPPVLYPILIPTLEPHMTTARLDVVCQDVKSFRALFEILVAAKHRSIQNKKSIGIKWPLTGGVLGQPFKENHPIIQVYIAGYQDGSVRIWDATYPAFSLVYDIKSEVNDINIGNASAPVSALGFCPDTLHLAVGDESGVVRLYGLIRSSDDSTLHFVTENGTEVHNTHKGDGPHCKAVFSLQNSAVYSLQFANFGGKLVVGYEHGQVAMLDISSSSVLFVTKTESNTSSAVVSMHANFSDSSLNKPLESVSDISENPGMGLVYVMTRDEHFVAIDTMTGNMACNGSTSDLSAEKLTSTSPQKSDSGMQANIQSENAQVEDESAVTVENSYFGQIISNSLILLCYENELSLHSLNFVIEGSSKYIRKVNLVQRCCWTTTFKKDEKECVLVLLYQSGDIELRSLPALEVLGESSLMSILRWNLETNMVKTICSSSNGKIILVNGNETAFISLLNCENEFWTPESFPCLHDEVLAAAVDATASLSPKQNERKGASSIFVNIAKNFKAGNADQNANQSVHTNRLENLKQLFSSPPFLKSSSSTVDKQDPFAIDIDDIQIDEPVVFSSPQKIDIDKRDKGKGTDRQKLLEEASSDLKPKARTAEEIKAKYRKTGTGDASAAAALARDKLVERQEKLQILNERTEELQNGAQDFASMATELAKRMENRKWWQL